MNPDAVLSGSRIWDSSWREERAANYGIAPDELEEHYRAAHHAGGEHRARGHRGGRAAFASERGRPRRPATCSTSTAACRPRTRAEGGHVPLCGWRCSSPASTIRSSRTGRRSWRARTCSGGGRLPDGADVLRADALQHGLPARDDPPGAAFRRGLRRRRSGRLATASCVGMVREVYPDGGRGGRPASPPWSSDPRVHELSEFLVNTLGIEDVGASFPHRVTFHPTCHSQRMLRIGDAPRGCSAGCGVSTSWSCRAPRSVAASGAPSR